MDNFDLEITVNVKKNGKDFSHTAQISFGLDKEQLVDMQQDLIAVRRHWEDVTGLVRKSK